MFQNIKVDIIYYKTNTDFEMEFNLCGCCRMRLLTDKASDKKGLVHNLARAVSRSRVILIVGALFGDDGIIETAAQAIGKTLSPVDNRRYGVAGEDKISIINGATPLVTQDGYFGGCIIESGPQSMILLSENKTVRKTIMSTLIHPYIEELCAIELKSKAAQGNSAEITGSAIPHVPPVLPDIKTNSPDLPFSATSDTHAENIITEESYSAPLDYSEIADADVSVTENDKSSADAEINVIAEDNQSAVYTEAEAEEIPSEIQEVTENTVTEEISTAEKAVEKPLPPPEENIQVSGKMVFETDEYRAVSADLNDFSEKQGSDNNMRSLHTGDETEKNRSDIDFDYEDIDFRVPGNKPKSFFSGNMPILIVSILLLIVIAVLCYCIFYIPAREGVSASAYLQETFKDFFI